MSKSEINDCSIQLLDPDPRVKKSFYIKTILIKKKKVKKEGINPQTMKIVFLLFLVVTGVFYGVIRIEETKLVCAISRKYFLFKNHLFFA